MSTNSRFVIASHILTLLANGTAPVPSPTLAGSIGVNPVTVRRIMLALREHGLVETVIGSTGGATLARKASAITLRDVYLCVREGTLFGAFPEDPSPDCMVGRNVQHVLEDVLDDTEQRMIAPLAHITVADLLRGVTDREEAQATLAT